MNKHKLSGYCIRGGEKIAERIRKVFEADGVDMNIWNLDDLSVDDDYLWYIRENSKLDCRPNEFYDLTEITISEAEAIVYGWVKCTCKTEPQYRNCDNLKCERDFMESSEKTFPREMLVSDDESIPIEMWPKRTVDGCCPYLEHPYLISFRKDCSPDEYYGYRYARELPETIPYKTAKEIIYKATSKEMDDFEIDTKKD